MCLPHSPSLGVSRLAHHSHWLWKPEVKAGPPWALFQGPVTGLVQERIGGPFSLILHAPFENLGCYRVDLGLG